MAIFSYALGGLSMWVISAGLAMVILVTICFEKVTHWIEQYCEHSASDLNSTLFTELLHKLQRELMILGFISFSVMMLLESHVLSHSSGWVVGFEFAHLSIFFIALAYIVQASVLASVTSRMKQWVYKARGLNVFELIEATWEHKYFGFDQHFLFLEFHIARLLFIHAYKLPEEFNFANYIWCETAFLGQCAFCR
jgi:hypothetical protein